MVMPNSNGTSVIKEPPMLSGSLGPQGDLVLWVAQIADDIPLWGTAPRQRDLMLRRFWHSETLTASAVTSTAAKYAAFGWWLEGPPRTVRQVQQMFHWIENGEGWVSFLTKLLIDLFTQDNGAFIEVVRTGPNYDDPVVTLNHLDSARCVRTGHRETPIIYTDIYGTQHEMQWWQVIPLAEMPSPDEAMRGMQYCAVTRLLRAAQIMRDIAVYEREKIGGRFNRAIILVGGVQQKTISNVLERQQAEADTAGLTRYLNIPIIAALDPTATVSKQVIELASLPDHFDKDTEMRWFINQLALSFLTDYQEFAPLPAGNLGTSQQSQILAAKSRGKGPALFMSLMEHTFNFRGLLPDTVTFHYGSRDLEENAEKADVAYKRAQTRSEQIKSGEITPDVARQMAVDSGDLKPEYLQLLNETDVTSDVRAIDNIPVTKDIGHSVRKQLVYKDNGQLDYVIESDNDHP